MGRRGGPPQQLYRCECGKWAYGSRQDARRAARIRHPGARLCAYQCRVTAALGPVWHFGHVDTYIRDRNHRAREAT